MTNYQAAKTAVRMTGIKLEFPNDLRIHDRAFIGENPGATFLYFVYEGGTHIAIVAPRMRGRSTAREFFGQVLTTHPSARSFVLRNGKARKIRFGGVA